MERERDRFWANVISSSAKRRNTKYSPRAVVMKFHRGQKWLSSRSTDPQISLPPCISPSFYRIEQIELDRLLDRKRFLAKTRNVLSPLSLLPANLANFHPPSADRISRYFHQLSRCLPRNLRSEDGGNCLEVALDLSLGNQKYRGSSHGRRRKFEYIHVVHLLFPQKDRFGIVRVAICSVLGLLRTLSYIVDMDTF